MALRADLINSNTKGAPIKDLEKMRLKHAKKKKTSQVSKEVATAWAKARWLGMMTAPVEERLRDK